MFRRHQDNLRKIVDKEDLESVCIVPPLPEGVEQSDPVRERVAQPAELIELV